MAQRFIDDGYCRIMNINRSFVTTWSQPALLVGQYERGVLGSWFLPALLVGQFERGWFDEFNGSFTQNPQSNQFCGSTTELIGRCPVFVSRYGL